MVFMPGIICSIFNNMFRSLKGHESSQMCCHSNTCGPVWIIRNLFDVVVMLLAL